ncbi:ABC transporter ATP-binding protein [Fimbriimonas ginsengisoli]|uniref:Sulfate ABC transporter ATP-binding protein n=1 Tax=Fimbriimonas ginsengisoli Gsoil 348 TaxID=661478 RepID=A0A068NL84_FIMGI|nr:ABC transporter ATP-binding protein [Fimbriimonas ginsengisoli]AIE84338.1 sulfate ABC transporter ATP-binding protein [Fimbriimonas ginsengisoli Gsoil 348]
MSSLSIRNLSKRFGGPDGLQALEDVSIEVPEGEFLILVGPSGCGKSTLLNIVAGLEVPDTGQVLVDGKPIQGPGPDRSLVFQDGALFPWLSVRQNVEFGLKQARVPTLEREERARRALDKVGLAKFEDHAIHELSGGMRQRVAIARSLVLEPGIILMDEPFSALDALTREDLYLEVQDLWRERRSTVVFVTHNVREAVTLGDRVLLFSARPGRIQESFDIDILPPRHIDDVDVARTAQSISHAMKAGTRTIYEHRQTPDILLRTHSPLGDSC